MDCISFMLKNKEINKIYLDFTREFHKLCFRWTKLGQAQFEIYKQTLAYHYPLPESKIDGPTKCFNHGFEIVSCSPYILIKQNLFCSLFKFNKLI